MATALAALTREQKEVFQSMPKAWQAATKKAIGIQQNLLKTGIMGRYELGEIVRDFTKDERSYGEEAVPNLAVVLDEDPNNLWQYRQFVGTYTRNQVEALLGKAAKAGYKLTWSHLDALSGIAGTKATAVRKQLEQACIVERLNVAELRAKIQKKKGGKTSQGGRKPNKPRNILQGVGQMEKAFDTYANKWNGWAEVIWDGVANAGPDQITEETVEQLEEGKKSQEQLAQWAQEAVENYESAIERAKAVLAKKKAKAASAAAKPTTNGAPKKKAAAKGATATRGAKKKAAKKKGSVSDRVANARKKRAKRPQPA